MGIPAAPDVANLYCAYYEKSFAGEFPLFYRYIDDLITIVEAPTKDEATVKLQETVVYEGLELTWEVEEESVNFLDLEITLGSGNLISFRPYRKPLNHFERIPFSSAHPLWVKKSAFIGEMSRIARLCSSEKTYINAIIDLKDIYLRRDYPVPVIRSWVKAYMVKRWLSRHEKKREAEEEDNSLWLKSEYNPVWDHIDTRLVWKSMANGLEEYKSTLDFPVDGVKVSYKRTRNLNDATNDWFHRVITANQTVHWPTISFQEGLALEENERRLANLEDSDDDEIEFLPVGTRLAGLRIENN